MLELLVRTVLFTVVIIVVTVALVYGALGIYASYFVGVTP